MVFDEHLKRHQHIRIRRLGMAAVSYCLTALIAAVAALTGVLAWRYVGHYLIAATTINAVLLLLFATRLNLRFPSPNLTTLQISLSLLPALYVMLHMDSPQARTAIVLIAIVPMLYGILDLTVRHFLALSLVNMIAYMAMFALLVSKQPERLYAPGEWVVILALAALMVQLALIGGYISQLRHSLHQKNRQLNEAMTQISEMAVRDELTSVYNRRHLMDVLQAEIDRTRRGETRFSTCMMDIDHFKAINDQHGHLTGDEVLRRCADEIRNNIREIDTFGRYGGEEFLLIMPLTGNVGAEIAADRLRQRIEALAFMSHGELRFGVTVSIGLTESTPGNTQDANSVLRQADEALYRAKAAGRNRVCTT